MNTYLVFLTSFVLLVLFRMTQVSMGRKEPIIYTVVMAGITGACFMLLVIQVAIW